jgi:predicted HTH transcriptional regulator
LSTFYHFKIIQSWGQGILEMAELMNQAGLPAPENETAAGEEDAYLLKSCGLAKYARKVENVCYFIGVWYKILV